MTKHKAFTLVELLVVIAIIAVLLAILMPSLSGAKGLARRLQCGKKLAGIGRAFTLYVTEYDSALPTVEFGNETDPAYKGTIQHCGLMYRTSPSGVRTWHHLGCLWARGFIDNPSHFYCPATENWRDDFGGGSLSTVPGRMLKGYVYWPMSKENYTQADWVALRDHKDQAANENYFPGKPRTATLQNELIMTKAIVCDYSFHELKSYGGSGWAVNALFPDGHVLFQPQPKDDGTGTGGMADKGKGMWHECRQFPGSICWITNWNARATWTEAAEGLKNVSVKSQIVRFMFELQP